MASIVTILEERLLGNFADLADRIVTQFPKVQARAYSSSVGAATEFQGHGFYVDCLFEDATDDETDNVALVVKLAYLTTQPRINADVCWGHPSGQVEAEVFSDSRNSPDWPEVSEETLAIVLREIPRLSNALIEAVQRRRPFE